MAEAQAEKTNAAFFARALDAVQNEKDLDLRQVGVCEACGYIMEGILQRSMNWHVALYPIMKY